jgi:hypothetical protein
MQKLFQPAVVLSAALASIATFAAPHGDDERDTSARSSESRAGRESGRSAEGRSREGRDPNLDPNRNAREKTEAGTNSDGVPRGSANEVTKYGEGLGKHSYELQGEGRQCQGQANFPHCGNSNFPTRLRSVVVVV